MFSLSTQSGNIETFPGHTGVVVWEAKAQLLLELAVDVKGKQSSFFYLQYQCKNKKEDVGPLLKGTGDLVKTDTDKAEVFHSFFLLIFTNKVL